MEKDKLSRIADGQTEGGKLSLIYHFSGHSDSDPRYRLSRPHLEHDYERLTITRQVDGEKLVVVGVNGEG